MFRADIWKNIEDFYLKNFRFLEIKFSIYLNRCVFVMWMRFFLLSLVRQHNTLKTRVIGYASSKFKIISKTGSWFVKCSLSASTGVNISEQSAKSLCWAHFGYSRIWYFFMRTATILSILHNSVFFHACSIYSHQCAIALDGLCPNIQFFVPFTVDPFLKGGMVSRKANSKTQTLSQMRTFLISLSLKQCPMIR